MSISIKYEQLSNEIKSEVTRFHETKVLENKDITIEETMRIWFDTQFDPWIESRFASNEEGDVKRKHHRIDVEVPIKVVDTLIESDGNKDDGIDLDIVGIIVNISRGGLFFKSKKKFETSSIIKVIIDMSALDPELSQIEAIAMVVRCHQEDDGEFGVGVMFSSIYGDHKGALQLFILKNLSYSLYN